MTKEERILDKLLKQIATEQNFVNYEIKVEPISSGGTNYTSHLYNVELNEINEGVKCIHMFAKVVAMGETMRSQAPGFCQTENIVYTKLIKIYEQLQHEHQVPQEHKLVFPKFYGCNTNVYEETIVLENLAKAGYEPYDRLKSVDWEYAKSAITELAKLHALSFAFSEYLPEEYNNIANDLKVTIDFECEDMIAFGRKATAKAIECTQERNREQMHRFFKLFRSSKFNDYFRWIKRPVLAHADYKPGNLMHKVRKDGTVDIKIVDYQTLQERSPLIDILYFIFTGSDEEFRAQYYEKLLDHYYTQLSASMKRLHLNPDKIYSRKDFEHELKEKLPFGLAVAVYTLPTLTLDAENAPSASEDSDLSTFSVDKTSDLYVERLNGVVNDYIRWGVLK